MKKKGLRFMFVSSSGGRMQVSFNSHRSYEPKPSSRDRLNRLIGVLPAPDDIVLYRDGAAILWRVEGGVDQGVY